MKNTQKNSSKNAGISTNKNISVALAQIRQRITDAEHRFKRDPDSVQLLAVSKTRPVTDIQAAIDAGQICFAENYLQEAVEKIMSLKTPQLVWHFIGSIQSNKTRDIAQHFHWAHTIDRIKIARRLNDLLSSLAFFDRGRRRLVPFAAFHAVPAADVYVARYSLLIAR